MQRTDKNTHVHKGCLQKPEVESTGTKKAPAASAPPTEPSDPLADAASNARDYTAEFLSSDSKQLLHEGVVLWQEKEGSTKAKPAGQRGRDAHRAEAESEALRSSSSKPNRYRKGLSSSHQPEAARTKSVVNAAPSLGCTFMSPP